MNKQLQQIIQLVHIRGLKKQQNRYKQRGRYFIRTTYISFELLGTWTEGAPIMTLDSKVNHVAYVYTFAHVKVLSSHFFIVTLDPINDILVCDILYTVGLQGSNPDGSFTLPD